MKHTLIKITRTGYYTIDNETLSKQEVLKWHENIEEREPVGLPKKSINIQGGEAESECEVFKPI